MLKATQNSMESGEAMNIFDILGPIMVGPSSSHTAGVVRIGNVVNKILGDCPKKAAIKFHGSFSTTYMGHGSDKAIVAGLLGFQTDDPRIKTSFDSAKEQGMEFSFETIDLKNAHPNSILIEAESADGEKVELLGESIGGGNIVIRRINGIAVEFSGTYDTLITCHKDAPGAIALVSNLLSVEGINIATMNVFRARKAGDAIMIIEADGKLKKSLAKTILSLPHIEKAFIISGI